MVVNEGHDSAAEGNAGNGGGGIETGNHSDEVADQNEKAQRHQERGETFAVRADNLAALVLNEDFRAFHDVLQAAGFIHGKAAADKNKKQNKKSGHQNLHGDGIG